MPGEIVVRGHTDARPYRSATYDNWRLSSARAQMAYYMLIRGGLPEKRFERIEGYADRRSQGRLASARGRKPPDRNSRARADAVTSARRAWASAALALLAPAAALADSANLAEMVDDLQRIQLQIAQGDKAAYAAQLNQLKTIGAAIAAAGPETWKDRREADSLVIYILSGGSLADVVAAPERRRGRRVRAGARARRARLRHQS